MKKTIVLPISGLVLVTTVLLPVFSVKKRPQGDTDLPFEQFLQQFPDFKREMNTPISPIDAPATPAGIKTN